jgi:hypothetical protein
MRTQRDPDTNLWRWFRAPRASYGGEKTRITHGAALRKERKRKEERKEGSGAFLAHQSCLFLRHDLCSVTESTWQDGWYHRAKSRQCTWHDSFISRVNSTKLDRLKRIRFKKNDLFISQILIKRVKIWKNSLAAQTQQNPPLASGHAQILVPDPFAPKTHQQGQGWNQHRAQEPSPPKSTKFDSPEDWFGDCRCLIWASSFIPTGGRWKWLLSLSLYIYIYLNCLKS